MKLPHIRLRRTMRQLGPGSITGAADDDARGIATYSQAGAQFGYAMLMVVMMLIATNPRVMDANLIGRRLRALGSVATTAIAATVAAMLVFV